jgi:lipid-binding SYLF domain-containing protein
MAGCTTAPKTEAGKDKLADNVDTTMTRLHQEDPSLQPFLDHSAAYVVFPRVGKGAFIVGGARGRGILYENGMAAGYADLTQASVGAQAGAQAYALVVAFENPTDVARFKTGKFTFAANSSAVALKSGAARTAKFQDGTVVFNYPLVGGMVEAAIGGQSLTYVPMEQDRANRTMDNNRMDRPATRPADMR